MFSNLIRTCFSLIFIIGVCGFSGFFSCSLIYFSCFIVSIWITRNCFVFRSFWNCFYRGSISWSCVIGCNTEFNFNADFSLNSFHPCFFTGCICIVRNCNCFRSFCNFFCCEFVSCSCVFGCRDFNFNGYFNFNRDFSIDICMLEAWKMMNLRQKRL